MSAQKKDKMITGRDTSINREVLALVKRYCGAKRITKFLADQKREIRTERHLLGNSGKDTIISQQVNFSVEDDVSFDQLITVCRQNLKDNEFQEALLDLGDIFKSHGIWLKAEEIFGLVINYGLRSELQDWVAEGLLRRGEIYSRLGRWAQSEQDLTESRNMFLKLHNIVALARIENILGTNRAEQGDIQKAVDWFGKAFERFEQARQGTMAGIVLMNLGVTRNIIGEWDDALNYYQRALPRFQEAGDVTRLAELRHNMGMTYLAMGKYEKAVGEFDRSLTFARAFHSPNLMGISLLGKAHAHYRMADRSLALIFCNKALEELARTDCRMSVADAYKVKGMVLRDLKKFDMAETYFMSSIRINEEYCNNLNLGEVFFELGQMEIQRRRAAQGVLALRKAQSYFKRVGARAEVTKTNSQLKTLEKLVA